MRFVSSPQFLAVGVLAACTVTYAADVFVPAGAKATLSVDYLYESAGRKSSNGGYDPYEWKVKRNLRLTRSCW